MSMLPLVIQIERTQERLADTCAFASSPVRIGRNPLSDLQLEESFVSQWHGVISFNEQHTTYVDLGSTNPTLIDGEPIERNVEVEVTDKTDIRIGSLRLHVLRVPADPELFGVRRKTSFMRGAGHANAATIDTRASASNPQPSASGLSATGVVTRDRSVPPPSGVLPIYDGAPQLESMYREYARTRARLIEELRLQLEAAAPSEREALCESIFERHPELGHEPTLRDALSTLGIEPWRTGVPDTTDWLRRLTAGLYPPPGQQAPINLALALERIGELLEVWSSAFIELRSAHRQCCQEIGLDEPAADTLLHNTHDPKAVLAYLLNPDTTHSNKLSELARAMADFALHPVALVSAVIEGAGGVLQALSPATLAGRGERPTASFIGKLLGGDQRELWTRYVTAFDELTDADRFTRKLFGRSFARKYYAIMGGRRSLPSAAHHSPALL